MPTNKPVFKAGIQSSADPYEFVMSTDAVDRMGDIVEQDWKLSGFRRNAVALWAHQHDQPIGTWENVKVVGNKLIGRLKLAEKGTSDLIDTLRSLVEQRILKAVSVGFRPGKAEPLDEKAPYAGYRLSQNELLECSLCSVPANQEALSIAKSLDSDVRARLLASIDEPSGLAAHAQLGIPSHDSDHNPPQKPSIKRPAKMSLSKKIETKQTQLNDLRDQLTTLDDSYDAAEDMPTDVAEQFSELTDKVDRAANELETLRKAENSMKLRAAEQASEAPTETKTMTPRIETKKVREKGFGASAAITAMIKAHADRTSAVALAETAYKDDPEVAIIVKAATAPGDTTTDGWASQLVRDSFAAFLDLVRDMSIYPALPGLRVEFDRSGKIVVPRNAGRGTLSGAWVEEGNPVPVKAGVLNSTDLAPKKLAVISTFTRELATHSVPAIQQLVQQQMLEDTAESLDTFYMDDVARSAARPAGMQDVTETGAGAINAATGATAANINADLKGMISRMLAARAGNAAVWVLSRINVLNLRMVQDAASGAFIFRSEIDGGTLLGYPIISSQNIADDLVLLQGGTAVTYGNDYSPMIDVNDSVTLVMDTAPDQIIDSGTPTTQDVRSLWQNNEIAVKMHLGLDWRIVRTGGVQVLTGTDWS